MAYLDLSPVIIAIRERPDEFEMIRGNLHHRSSRHSFQFRQDGELRVLADCDCALLMTRPEEAATFKSAFDGWHASYWRAVEINREFASHFRRRRGWREVCARILARVIEHLQAPPAAEPVVIRRPISR